MRKGVGMQEEGCAASTPGQGFLLRVLERVHEIPEAFQEKMRTLQRVKSYCE